MKSPKLLIITAPSGSGKTTLVRRLMGLIPDLAFSVSACTRQARDGERDGHDYYFISAERFKELIEEEAFLEWEMVYEGKYYGTLRLELNRIWNAGQSPLVDIDVKGALAMQKQFPGQSLSVFIQPPSLEVLRERLIGRGSETPQSLEERVSKAAFELSFAPAFNYVLVNDNLDQATAELAALVQDFLADKESAQLANPAHNARS